MKLRLLPPLWMVWVPLFSPGALPQPAVVAAAAGGDVRDDVRADGDQDQGGQDRPD